MKNIRLILVNALVLFFLSCNHKSDTKQKTTKQSVTAIPEYTRLLNNEVERTRLWKSAIDSGDFGAYNKIAVAYLMSYREIDLYYYSLIMANKHHCPEAYYNMFTILENKVSTNEMDLYSTDKDTKNLALYYLLKSSELGLAKAKFDIELKFGKGKSVPNSSYFLYKLTGK
jgi:TPR repeat protein